MSIRLFGIQVDTESEALDIWVSWWLYDSGRWPACAVATLDADDMVAAYKKQYPKMTITFERLPSQAYTTIDITDKQLRDTIERVIEHAGVLSNDD